MTGSLIPEVRMPPKLLPATTEVPRHSPVQHHCTEIPGQRKSNMLSHHEALNTCPWSHLFSLPVTSFSVVLARAATLSAKQRWSEQGGTERTGGCPALATMLCNYYLFIDDKVKSPQAQCLAFPASAIYIRCFKRVCGSKWTESPA